MFITCIIPKDMRESYFNKGLSLVALTLLLFMIASCKKDKSTSTKPVNATPVKLGLYEESDSIIYKILFMPVTKIGTVTLNDSINGLVFDTGSGGLVIDAEGILPSSMISSSGFIFTTDSITVDGITITNKTQTITYGDDANTTATVYGNLAYASVEIGEQSGNITVKRLPFFIYYKALDDKGKLIPAHEFDVFGVDPEYDITFDANTYVASPFMYYPPGTGLINGFKLPALGTGNFSDADDIPITPGVITLGLTAADLSTSSGYTFTTLDYRADEGADPVIPATIAYNSKSISANVVFDSGTDPYNYIEDNTASKTTTKLPVNSTVSVATNSGFNYGFTTTATDYLTNVENPSTSKTNVSILSLEYFLKNEYLLDYTDHKLGLKND